MNKIAWKQVLLSGFSGLCLLSGVSVLMVGAGVGLGYGFTIGVRLAGLH